MRVMSRVGIRAPASVPIWVVRTNVSMRLIFRVYETGTEAGAHAGRTYKRFDAMDVAGSDTGTEAGAPPGQKYKRFSLHSGRWTRSVVLSGYGPTIAGYQSKCHKAAQHAQQKRQHV